MMSRLRSSDHHNLMITVEEDIDTMIDLVYEKQLIMEENELSISY
jgi:hypothetical protein